MATLDTSMYGTLKPAEFENPLIAQGRLMQLMAAKDQQAMGALQRQQLERQLAREGRLAQLAQGDPSTFGQRLREAGFLKDAVEYEKNQATVKENEAKASKEQEEAAAKQLANLKEAFKNIPDTGEGYEGFRAQVNAATKGRINLPATFSPELRDRFVMGVDEHIKRQFPQLSFQNAGNAVLGLNPYTGQQVSSAQRAPEGFVRDAQGNLTVEPGYLAAKGAIARAGKTDVNLSVNTDRTLYGEVAKGIGEDIVNSRVQARNALSTIQNVQQMADILRSGNFISGPGANAEVLIGQIGEKFGVAGKDQAEKIANTRSMIQAMAKSELSVAGEMKGQGQITENERKLIARAASGDITMTPGELRTLGQSLDKTARSRIRSSNQNAASLQQDPRFSGNLGRVMQVDEPPPVDFGQQPAQQSSGARQPQTFQTPPDPSQNRGKWMTDAQGNRYQSDGQRWVRK